MAATAEQRRHEILGLLTELGFVGTADLARRFGVSEVTIRGDIAALARDEPVERVHGGAVVRPARGGEEPTFEHAASTLAGQKRRIGDAAAALVEPGSAVAIDVGTTAVAVADALVRREELTGVTVITNSIAAALALEPAIPRITVIVSGGTLRPRQHSLVAPYAAETFGRFRADLAVIGCTGVDADHGVTNVNAAEAELKRVIAGIARRVVVVADASKLGRVDLGHVLDLADVDHLITGAEAAQATVHRIRTAGSQMILA